MEDHESGSDLLDLCGGAGGALFCLAARQVDSAISLESLEPGAWMGTGRLFHQRDSPTHFSHGLRVSQKNACTVLNSDDSFLLVSDDRDDVAQYL